ncbi:MAG: hypothetical protein LBM93_13735, partial [Oscillospiraceae bacterium]|nr:hypothetical protein [Oscillospiraceae bacterium]
VYFSNIYKNGFKLPIESNKISDFIIIQYKDLPEEDGIKRRFVENRNGRYCYIGSNSDPNKRSVIWNETEKKADIKIQGNIDERITDTKFVLKYFQTSMKKEDYNEFENLLGDLSQIKDVLEYVGISRDFDLDDLSSTDRNNLFRLVTSIENEHIDSESTDKPFIASVFTFMGNNVLLYKKYLNGNKYKWVNFFRETIPCTFGFRDKEENDMLNISIFLVCDKSIFKRFINSDYDKILTGLKKSDITPDIANVLCLKTICNMISAYDEDNTNLEVLDTAYKFGEWLEVNTEIDKSCLLINQLQIKKRKNQLTPKDYSLLATLIQNEYDNIKFGAYTLLEDYENAKDSFSKIPAEEQNDLINSPIYRLYSELSENIAVAIG